MNGPTHSDDDISSMSTSNDDEDDNTSNHIGNSISCIEDVFTDSDEDQSCGNNIVKSDEIIKSDKILEQKIRNLSTDSTPKVSHTYSTPKVSHTYIDYSLIHPRSQLKLPPTRKNIFPLKMTKILSDPTTQDIVSWKPHGRCFKVKDVDKFQKYVLPQHFKTNLMKSFRKQLSLWGFKRITRGIDAGSYYHESFLRGMPHLLGMMKYEKVKGIGKAPAPNPDEEPDFYNFPALPSIFHNPTYTKCPRSFILDQWTSVEYDDPSDDDNSFTYEEYIAVNSLMTFPEPFRPPPEIWYL